MSKFLAIAIPVLPGKEAEWNKWRSELTTTHRAEFVDLRKKLKVHERTFLQHTPMGDMVIITLEGDNPEAAFGAFSGTSDAFTRWFVDGVKNLHGIDLTQPPPGPMPELIIDSEA